MIDDLFTDLVVRAVDRLAAPDTPRDEAEFGLAWINVRLSSQEIETSEDSVDRARDLNGRLLGQYLGLGVDDLHEISVRVHEWMLERLSQEPSPMSRETTGILRNLYFLFPETTIRSAVVGLLMQADRQQRRLEDRERDSLFVSMIPHAIDRDEGLSQIDRLDEVRRFVDLALDYVDVFPEQTEAMVAALPPDYRQEVLRQHLLDWATRLGGEAGERLRRIVEPPERR